jgi:hypothetical protein
MTGLRALKTWSPNFANQLVECEPRRNPREQPLYPAGTQAHRLPG